MSEPAREIATDREVSEAALAALVDAIAQAQSRQRNISGDACAVLAGPTSDPMHVGDEPSPLLLREAQARGLVYQPSFDEYRVVPGSHPAVSVDGGGAGD